MSAFKVQTNWCVITGAPSSGKTSVINELAVRGYETEPEVARELMNLCLKRGQKIEEVREKKDWLQSQILRLKMERERQHKPEHLVFLDRGIPDSITYYRIAGLDLAPVKKAARQFHYRAIFIFDRLPIVRDDVRTESEEIAQQIDLGLERDYRDLDYLPVRVPAMPIQARADFILKSLGV
jgi:predicted ATPase